MKPEFVLFTNHPLYILVGHNKCLEIWRLKEGATKSTNVKPDIESYDPFYCFINSEYYDGTIDDYGNPDGVAYTSHGYNQHLFAAPQECFNDKLPNPDVNEMRAIALVAQNILNNPDKRFNRFRRALELFLGWEYCTFLVRHYSNKILQTPALRLNMPIIAKILDAIGEYCTSLEGLKVGSTIAERRDILELLTKQFTDLVQATTKTLKAAEILNSPDKK